MILPLYRLGTWAAYPLIYPFGRRKIAAGDSFWSGRLGRMDAVQTGGVWMHAASAGEVKINSYLASKLIRQQPDLPLVGSSQTRTGFDLSHDLFPEGTTVTSFPLDCPQSVRRSLTTAAPSVIAIAETEIWFNFLSEAFRMHIPVVQVNGRMTEKAYQRYRKIGGTMKSLLSQYSKIYCKSEEDASRYIALGAESKDVEVVGDMKFDAPLGPRSEGRIVELRARLHIGGDDFLVTAGSTRPGEEQMLTELLASLKQIRPSTKLVVAPRHIQRSEEVAEIFRQAGFKAAMYSINTEPVDVVVVDEFGLLGELYMAADIAFVGGSLVDLGGHNILEPVWAGTPVLFGPSTSNIEESVSYVTENNYGGLVRNLAELSDIIMQVQRGAVKFDRIANRNEKSSPSRIAADYILGLIDHA